MVCRGEGWTKLDCPATVGPTNLAPWAVRDMMRRDSKLADTWDELSGSWWEHFDDPINLLFSEIFSSDHQDWVAAATASRLRAIQDTVSSVAAELGIEVITSASALAAAQNAGAQVYFQSAVIGVGYNSQTRGISTRRVVTDLFGSTTPGVPGPTAIAPLDDLPAGTYANSYTASYCQAARSMGQAQCDL